ncbi:MAG: hypothetical protein ACOZAR_05460 [Patescibacteria group bacterium]
MNPEKPTWPPSEKKIIFELKKILFENIQKQIEKETGVKISLEARINKLKENLEK